MHARKPASKAQADWRIRGLDIRDLCYKYNTSTLRVHACAQANLVSALEVQADDEHELLLTYGRHTRFQKLGAPPSPGAAPSTAPALQNGTSPSRAGACVGAASASSTASAPGSGSGSSGSAPGLQLDAVSATNELLSATAGSAAATSGRTPMARQGSTDRLRNGNGNAAGSGSGSNSNTNLNSCALDFQWHSEPIAVVCAFPYIVAFTEAQTIEVRLIINGSLVHSMLLPHLQFITAKVCSLPSLRTALLLQLLESSRILDAHQCSMFMSLASSSTSSS